LPDTKRYIDALCKRSEVEKSHFTISRKGNSKKFHQGTWFHPKLGVPFARWVDVDFAIWCDEQIDKIIKGELDVKRARHQAASSYKVLSSVLEEVRKLKGKETKFYHYANEAKLINWALTGQFTRLDRDSL